MSSMMKDDLQKESPPFERAFNLASLLSIQLSNHQGQVPTSLATLVVPHG